MPHRIRRAVALIAVAVALTTTGTALAHHPALQQEWVQYAEPGIVQAFTEVPAARFSPPTVAPGCGTYYDAPPAVERWRHLVADYFPPCWVNWALRIIRCESNGDPLIRNRAGGTASGLFQHLPRYWDARATKAGWDGADIFDAEANVAVSAWLFNDGRGRSHWACHAHQ